MGKQEEHKWQTKEANNDLIVFTLYKDAIQFEVIPEGAYGPEERQGTQNIEDFIKTPYPWIKRYPGLHEKTVEKIVELKGMQ